MNYSQVTVDILQNPKYAGAISSVSWLTDWIDSGFGMVITIVAFLIILVAMFKNVLAAAYCAYPKFWDRVDAAHKEVESIGWIQQFKDTFLTKDINSGSFSNAIMRILPNIKTLTDFEGDTVRPKTYFIRAIPQMLICIIIGAFIYNGYYRDTAAKVVDFGSEMVSRVLLEVDPIAVFDQFTGAAGRPVFASDGSELPEQKLINKLSTTVYNAVIGEYNDIKGADAKRALADSIEGKMERWVGSLADSNASYVDGESWKAVLHVTLTTGEVSTDQVNGQPNGDGTIIQYAMQFPISDLNLSSNKHVGEPMYLRVRINFEKQVVKSGKHGVQDLTLHLSPSAQLGQDRIAIQCPAGSNLLLQGTTGSGAVGTNGGEGTITAIVGLDSSKNRNLSIQIGGNGSVNDTFTINGKGLEIKDTKNGTYHYIKYIVFDGGNTLSSADEDGRTGITWDTTDLGVAVKGSTQSTEKSDEKTSVE